jgi:hypothetical protein
MSPSSYRGQRVPEVFGVETRAGADAFVYCKGCGEPLDGEARRQKPKVVVAVMMCEACREKYDHALIPTAGAPTFCYRCGGPDEVFIQDSFSPVSYHVCPRCVPERAARYRAGDFEPVPRTFPEKKTAAPSENGPSFERRVLATVSGLTSDGAAGITTEQVVTQMSEGGEAQGREVQSGLADTVADMRRRGLLMISPSGDLRVTSAGQRWMADPEEGEPATAK